MTRANASIWSVRRWLTAVSVAVLGTVMTPSVTAWADSAGPTDYRTEIVSVHPDPVDAATFSVEGGDAFIRAEVAVGHTLMVYGYDGEEYVRIDADGTVFENRASESHYYNRERFGGGVPDIADSSAPPKWVKVDDDGEYAWHDHRAHWMSETPLIGMRAGDAFPTQTIDVAVDGRPTEITVRTTLQAKASPLWWILGAVVGCTAAGVMLMRRRWVQTAGLSISLIALVVGVAQAMSVPGSTGRPLTWWALPAATVATALAGYAMQADRTLIAAIRVAVGLELLVWSWPRYGGVLDAYRPTMLPTGLDRVLTVAIPLAALGLIAAAARWYRPTAAGASTADAAGLRGAG